MEKKKVKIISKSGSELSSPVVIGDEEYLIYTEGGGPKSHLIVTRVYKKGRVFSTLKADYRGRADMPDAENRIHEFMKNQHHEAISRFKDKMESERLTKIESEKIKEEKRASDYLKTVKTLLMRKNHRSALKLLKDAVEQYPDNPFLLSYYGCLDAIVNKRYKSGIDTCSSAITILKDKVPFGAEFFYPVLYLNLGRAYVAAGRKKSAIEAFSKGLETHRDNTEILRELQMLGIRKEPVVPFLRRSNPINKYIGRLLHKLGK